MGDLRLHEGELNVMELLWSNKELAARDIAKIIKEYVGWEKNTTYTVINRLIDKGAITRKDPGFVCVAAVTKKAVRDTETKHLLDQFYNGNLSTFFNEYLKEQKLTRSEVVELSKIVNDNTIGNNKFLKI
ncbi:MAG: BlaI/MecI/CopY family transcriptional regulator [Catonella sp.]|jgi:predicted transcriptional regulator|nr:BlaI/MecI/CopY family transcriptional regulator [Catonella sp.]MDY6357417.1 BlaI/MecI/CopY family transcriptional regulator [Catonella sp.]